MKRKRLFGFERRLYDQYGRALIIENHGIDISTEKIDFAGFIEDLYSHIPTTTSLLLRSLFIIFALITLFPLKSLKGQRRTIERWKGSIFYIKRISYKLMSSLCFFAYYNNPDVQKAIGYKE